MRYIVLLIFFVSSVYASPKTECNGHALGGFSPELRQPSSCTTHGFLLPVCSSSHTKEQKKKAKKKTQGIRNQQSN